jgi:miniconductance mechanosensitive channel
VFIGLFVVDAFLNSVVDIYRTYEFAKRMPIKGFVQVIKIIVALLAFITVLAVVLKKDPSNLIAGMGAMTAIMLLIFKDSILGFVAGIQLSTNKMVHIGNWIEMSKFGADGDVIDITLTSVKVQNWDKTVTTIPSYALVSDSFKNWRGMSQSGGRRIMRSLHIDMRSIHFCDEATLEKLGKIEFLKNYIVATQEDIKAYNREHQVDEGTVVNGRRQTNIGIFRAYIVAYLKHHPKIHKNKRDALYEGWKDAVSRVRSNR